MLFLVMTAVRTFHFEQPNSHSSISRRPTSLVSALTQWCFIMYRVPVRLHESVFSALPRGKRRGPRREAVALGGGLQFGHTAGLAGVAGGVVLILCHLR